MNSMFLCLSLAFAAADRDRPTVLVVVGAPGTDEYGEQFRRWAGRWEAAAQQGQARFTTLGRDEEGDTSDRELLRRRLAEGATDSSQALWLVLIGHGTVDGNTATV